MNYLIFILVGLLIAYLGQSSTKKPVIENGFKVLKISKKHLVLGYFLIFASVLSLCTIFVDKNNGQIIVPIIIFGVLQILGWWNVRWVNQKQVLYNDNELILKPTFGSKKVIIFSEMNEVKFNENFETIDIKDGKNTIRIDLQTNGINQFIEFLKNNFNNLSTEAISKMQQFLRRIGR